MRTTALLLSDVMISFSIYWRRDPVVDHEALLFGEGHKNTSRRFGIDFTNKCRLTGPDRGFLLRAVAAIVDRKLIGVHNGVDLAREAKAYPYSHGFFERLRKHRNLPDLCSSRQTAATTCCVGHPRQWRADFFEDFGRLRKAYEGLLRGGKRIVALKNPLTGSERRLVYRSALVLRPLVEKFQRVFQTADFLNEMISVFHKDGVVERSFAHQSLQRQRACGFQKRPRPVAEKASNNMFLSPGNFKIGEAA